MIGYLEGKLLKKDEERVLLLAGPVGYEIMIPAFVMETLREKKAGDSLALYTYFHQTERQPAPVLIGFNSEEEKEFFLHFISVEAIGPIKAVKALTLPVGDIAGAIETGDVNILKNLKGIGARTAQKIIATLGGKVGKFTVVRPEKRSAAPSAEAFAEQVLFVLVEQLGYKNADARQMIADAIRRNSAVNGPEQLLDEILGTI